MGLFDTNGARSYTYDSATVRPASRNSNYSHHSRAAPSARGYYTRSSRSTTSLPNHTRSRSASRSWFGGGGGSSYGGNHHSNNSGWFSSFGGGGTSHYKRSPRRGYVATLVAKLRRLLRELWFYARKHPVKVFFAVVVPLISAGGAIGGLLKGVMPGLMGSALGGSSFGGSSRGYGGGRDFGGFGGSSWGGSGGFDSGSWTSALGGMGGLMQVAKAFM